VEERKADIVAALYFYKSENIAPISKFRYSPAKLYQGISTGQDMKNPVHISETTDQTVEAPDGTPSIA
jgi:hypothetical protein